MRRAKVSFFSGGQSHLATVAPASSNRSGRRGNDLAEASDGKDRTGDPASRQALTCVNAEQASKGLKESGNVRAPCKGVCSSVGFNPTWQLLLQPVAIGAVGKVTILPKPPMERVALATPRAGRP